MLKPMPLLLLALLAACGDVLPRDAAAPADRPAAAAAPAAGDGAAEPAGARSPSRDQRGIVLFIGTSLTAGYGLGESFAYPAVLQERIDEADLPFRVVNAGISGETSAGGLSRIDWMLQRPIDVLVLELGANDGLRGLDVAAMRRNLEDIITRTRRAHPDADIVLLGMEAPPNLGASYTRDFRQTYRDLARAHDAAFVPFLLEGVAGVASLNLEDGIHPNEEGQRRLARTVWPVLSQVLESRARSGAAASAR
jgi:acyl-CoA thioesterase I